MIILRFDLPFLGQFWPQIWFIGVLFYLQLLGSICILMIGRKNLQGFAFMGGIWMAASGIAAALYVSHGARPTQFDPESLVSFGPLFKVFTQIWPHFGPNFLGIALAYFVEHHPRHLAGTYRKYEPVILPLGLLASFYPLIYPVICDFRVGRPWAGGLALSIDGMACSIGVAAIFLYCHHNSTSVLARFLGHKLFAYHQKVGLLFFWVHIPISLVMSGLTRSTVPFQLANMVFSGFNKLRAHI